MVIDWRATVAIAALFAFLAIRNASPHFPRLPSLHHSAHNVPSNPGHRPHFDSERLQWSAPAGIFSPFPPVAISTQLIAFLQPPSKLQSKGFHYNRPPPAC